MLFYFADDTYLSYLSNSIKEIIKLVNTDFKYLVSWLNANKISLDVKKTTETETVIFKFKEKTLKVI